MFAALLIPGLVLGGIAWGAVGVLRSRGKEEFTIATAANFYAQVMIVAGVVAVLAGIGVLIKLGLSQIDSSYSYYMPTASQLGPGGIYGGPTIAQQQTQDLILSSMLVGVGAIVAAGHWFLSRFLSGTPGAGPAWITRGTLVALTVLCGLEAVLATLIGGFQVLTYFIVGNQENPMQFGDAIGAAIVFVPAWIVAMTVLLRQARRPSAKTPPPIAAVAA